MKFDNTFSYVYFLLEKLDFKIIEETEFKKYNMDITYKSFIFRKDF